MSWVKLDDGFTDHRKIEPLTDRAFRLHVAGLCFCARTLSDGFIPESRVRRLLPTVTKGMVTELVNREAWERVDGGVNVVGYLEYNPSKAKVEKERAEATERKRKWQESKNAAGNTVPNGAANGKKNASPSNPVPSRRDKGRVSEEPSAVAVALAAESGATAPDTKLTDEQVALNVTNARAVRASLRAS